MLLQVATGCLLFSHETVEDELHTQYKTLSVLFFCRKNINHSKSEIRVCQNLQFLNCALPELFHLNVYFEELFQRQLFQRQHPRQDLIGIFPMNFWWKITSSHTECLSGSYHVFSDLLLRLSSQSPEGISYQS